MISQEEMDYLANQILKQDYIELKSGKPVVPKVAEMRLSSLGWTKYDELKQRSHDSNKVFIAMWFNDQTDKLRDSLKSGVSAAGYEPVVVDERHFTGNIMDFVIGSIRESKFLIADFTVEPEEQTKLINGDEEKGKRMNKGSRGGVYYEAGFARGLGLKVIHICKGNNISKNRLHFDVLQDNTIFWQEEDLKDITVRHSINNNRNLPRNLSEQLFDRIKSLFGVGHLYKESSNTLLV